MKYLLALGAASLVACGHTQTTEPISHPPDKKPADAAVTASPRSSEDTYFRLVKVEKGSIYEQLGLKENDIIKTINGKTIHNPSAAMDVYQTLKADGKIELLIERDGKEEVIRANLAGTR